MPGNEDCVGGMGVPVCRPLLGEGHRLGDTASMHKIMTKLTGAWLCRSDLGAVTKCLISRPGWGEAGGQAKGQSVSVQVLSASATHWGETPLGQLSRGLQVGTPGTPWASAAHGGHPVCEAPSCTLCLPCLTRVSDVTAQTRREQTRFPALFCLLAVPIGSEQFLFPRSAIKDQQTVLKSGEPSPSAGPEDCRVKAWRLPRQAA